MELIAEVHDPVELEPGERAVRWTCIGKRESAQGKLCQAWLDADGETRLYPKPLHSSAVAGDVYRFIVDDDSRIFTGGPKRPLRVTRHDDEAEVTRWQAQTFALETAFRAEATKRKHADGGSPELENALRVLRDAYKAQRQSTLKAGFMAYVIERVTKP